MSFLFKLCVCVCVCVCVHTHQTTNELQRLFVYAFAIRYDCGDLIWDRARATVLVIAAAKKKMEFFPGEVVSELNKML